jgi:hypothetical protein
MNKLYFLGLLLINFATHAEIPPAYDFNSGLLTLPFVNTPQGAYRAELQFDPKAQREQFKLIKATTVSEAVESNQSPHFDFGTGLLSVPYVTTQQGSYSASLQLAPNTASSNTLVFNLTRANTYIAPRANKIHTCSIFPADNVWNTPVDTLPLHNRSNAWINTLGTSKNLHMDFGAGQWGGGTIGIPYNLVAGASVAKSNINFVAQDESDAAPYPIPSNYKIESGSDRHLLIVDTAACQLYELFDARYNNHWEAYSGAIWNLRNNQLRPNGWTSADAAGLPVFAGLLRYDEMASGFIGHAIRFTIPSSSSYVWPARHLTSGEAIFLTDTPPLGARFRLKADVDISGFAPELQVILKAMQTYGVISADHGAGWYISGEPDDRWDNELLKKLETLKGSDFEAVETTCMMINPNSAQADPAKCKTVS